MPGLGLDERSSVRLRERLPATVLPLPGMGRNEPVPSLDALADRLLAELGEGPVVLVGHSQPHAAHMLVQPHPAEVAAIFSGAIGELGGLGRHGGAG